MMRITPGNMKTPMGEVDLDPTERMMLTGAPMQSPVQASGGATFHEVSS